MRYGLSAHNAQLKRRPSGQLARDVMDVLSPSSSLIAQHPASWDNIPLADECPLSVFIPGSLDRIVPAKM
jgi:hypothetical protein